VSRELVFRKFARPRQTCIDHWTVYIDAVTRLKGWERRNRKRNEAMRAECNKAFDAFEDACTRELDELDR
jgi:hypothetical protein